MSDLQCIEGVKNRVRAPSTKAIEASLSNVRLPRPKKTETKNKLYDIQVVAENGTQEKVHYIGYDSKYDEWKPWSEIVHTKPEFCSQDVAYSPLTEIVCCIKRRLLPSRSDDPDVRIQVPLDLATFKELQDKGIPQTKPGQAGTIVYSISQYSNLNDVFGEGWHFRVVNEVGDFSYVILKTFSFYLCKRRLLLQYEVRKDDDGTLHFQPAYIEPSNSVVISFVRGDGNKKKLSEFL